MNLLELRKHIRSVSGRFDLIDVDGAQSSKKPIIDRTLNAAIRYLDRASNIMNSTASKFEIINSDEFFIKVKNFRSVHSVWLSSRDVRYKLTPLNLTTFRSKFPDGLKGANSGAPTVYCTGLFRTTPADMTTLDGLGVEIPLDDLITKYMETMPKGFVEYNGILIGPKADTKYLLEVVGNFYSDTLELDTDSNYWTIAHPEIVTMATMLQLEILNRNTQGVKDYQYALKDHLTQLDMDFVENESFSDVMEG